MKNGCQQCKQWAPFPLSDIDWIKEDSQWGPKQTYGYFNNQNPPFLHCLQSNHNLKLITNGADTKDLSFYISNYMTKKQTKSFNTSVLLAMRLAYHHKQERYNTDVANVNKKLIQQCTNTLTRQHEFRMPEVVLPWLSRCFCQKMGTVFEIKFLKF